MQRTGVNLAVGLFMGVGLLLLGYLAVKLGDVGSVRPDHYEIKARFVSVSGLREGAFVEVAGVRVGKVLDISLDNEEYRAIVAMSLPQEVQLQDDTIASIRTSGIIGDKFVKLTPGGSPIMLQPGEEIFDTESSISLEELISKYIFESGK